MEPLLCLETLETALKGGGDRQKPRGRSRTGPRRLRSANVASNACTEPRRQSLMHSRIAKILVLGALMLALPLIATAQTSRVQGMSIQGDYIKDYTGIFTYTSGVSNVGNLVYGELGVATGGTPVDRSIGAVMG